MFTLLYFSPTGNAQHVAKLLASHLHPYGVTMSPLETVRPDRLTENEHLVLLYPIHGFNAPRPEQAIGPRLSKFLPIKNGYSLSRYLEC